MHRIDSMPQVVSHRAYITDVETGSTQG